MYPNDNDHFLMNIDMNEETKLGTSVLDIKIIIITRITTKQTSAGRRGRRPKYGEKGEKGFSFFLLLSSSCILLALPYFDSPSQLIPSYSVSFKQPLTCYNSLFCCLRILIPLLPVSHSQFQSVFLQLSLSFCSKH
jgi:hypothetical protein